MEFFTDKANTYVIGNNISTNTQTIYMHGLSSFSLSVIENGVTVYMCHWPSKPAIVISTPCEDKHVESAPLCASCCSCLCQWRRVLCSGGDEHRLVTTPVHALAVYRGHLQ